LELRDAAAFGAMLAPREWMLDDPRSSNISAWEERSDRRID